MYFVYYNIFFFILFQILKFSLKSSLHRCDRLLLQLFCYPKSEVPLMEAVYYNDLFFIFFILFQILKFRLKSSLHIRFDGFLLQLLCYLKSEAPLTEAVLGFVRIDQLSRLLSCQIYNVQHVCLPRLWLSPATWSPWGFSVTGGDTVCLLAFSQPTGEKPNMSNMI